MKNSQGPHLLSAMPPSSTQKPKPQTQGQPQVLGSCDAIIGQLKRRTPEYKEATLALERTRLPSIRKFAVR